MQKSLDAIASRVCRSHCWTKRADGHPGHIEEPLDDDKIKMHLAGHKVYGACPINPGESVCRVALLDLDSHKGETPWEEMVEVAREIKHTAGLVGLKAIPFRSSGGKGIHLYFIWAKPQDAHSVRVQLDNIITSCGYSNGTHGVVKNQVEIFPKQKDVPANGWGSMFVLPYAGLSAPLNPADGWPESEDVVVIPQENRNERQTAKTSSVAGIPAGNALGGGRPQDRPGTTQLAGDHPARVGGSKNVDGGSRLGEEHAGGAETGMGGAQDGGRPQQPDVRGAHDNETADALVVRPSGILVRSALEAIPNSGEHELGYDEWIRIVHALHDWSRGNDEGRALAHEFSAKSAKYSPDFLDARCWDVAGKRDDRTITVKTLFHAARKHGWQDDIIASFDVLPPEGERGATGGSGGVAGGSAELAPPAGTGALRFPTLAVADFVLRPSASWFVKHVLPRSELALVIGDSGAGKSFFVLDLVAAIARGINWRQQIVQRSRVVYVAAEAPRGIVNRVRAYLDAAGVDNSALGNLRFIADAPNFMLVPDVVEVARSVTRFGHVGLIVVDTFAQVTPGVNENSGEDIGVALKNCRELSRATEAMVLLVHHTGKDATRGARGWSGLTAAADCIIEITRDEEHREARIVKQKDGEDGQRFGFKLSVRTLGFDEDTDPITSCVVVPTEARLAEPAHGKPDGVGALERRVVEAVASLGGLANTATPYAAVLNAVVDQLPHDVNDKRDRRPERVKRAIAQLVDKDQIISTDGMLRLPAEADDALLA